MIHHHDIDDGPFYSKMHKTCCCPSCCLPCNCLLAPCRNAVSGKKVRYVADDFDLDLTYLAPRIIVHGFPATGIEHIYRNPRYEIRRFLETHHPDKYFMYNFCCEPGRGYDPAVFHNRVHRYPFKDHNTPPLNTIVEFANDVKGWLENDPENVVSMHCKAGKGRAGLMSCITLIRTGFCASATEAMDHYDRTRVTNNKGLTVTSQRKYVIFYELLWRQYWGVSGEIGTIPAERGETRKYVVPTEPEINIIGVQLLGLVASTLTGLQIKIYQGTNFSPECVQSEGDEYTNCSNKWKCNCNVTGNFKIYVYKKTAFKTKKIFEMWHNTLFMEIDPSTGIVDFGQDQLDLKKVMRQKLGADVVLRVFLNTSNSPSSGGGEGDFEMTGLLNSNNNNGSVTIYDNEKGNL